MKNNESKGLKIVKGIGIGYLVFIGIGIVITIAIFILFFNLFFKFDKQSDEIKDKATNYIDQFYDGYNDSYNKINVDEFNYDLEIYSGTQYGSNVSLLLNDVITKIKKNANHSITVTYGTTTTSKPDEITTLKKQFDKTSEYEVSLDYDSDGYINKVTITNY